MDYQSKRHRCLMAGLLHEDQIIYHIGYFLFISPKQPRYTCCSSYWASLLVKSIYYESILCLSTSCHPLTYPFSKNLLTPFKCQPRGMKYMWSPPFLEAFYPSLPWEVVCKSFNLGYSAGIWRGRTVLCGVISC